MMTEFLGEGKFRKVFAGPREFTVTKHAKSREGRQSNKCEVEIYYLSLFTELEQWLAPIYEYEISKYNWIVQRRAEPVLEVPVDIIQMCPPQFSDKLQAKNWGLINGIYVLIDYGSIRNLQEVQNYVRSIHRRL